MIPYDNNKIVMTECLESYQRIINEGLSRMFGENRRGFPFDGLLQAMDYSLTAGGKRIRPALTLEFNRICGGDTETALPAALAVEMLHTYSLIHDDLPCMDNDELRRGRPCNHILFGEANALLAGDALQAEAFGTILRSAMPPERKLSCAEALADAAGIDGICGGQYMDLNEPEAESITEDFLSEMQGRKTGALLNCACVMGVLSAGGSAGQQEAALRYGAALGAAFQIRDDMLDELSSSEDLGKSVGSDKKTGKITYMSLYGADKCQEMISRLTDCAIESLSIFEDRDFLCTLAQSLAERKK